LDTLRKNNSSATFFCIGDNIRKHPGIFKRIVDEGHSVGNHTYNHLNGWQTGLDKYVENINTCDAEIKKIIGDREHTVGKLFRPPYGKVTRQQIRTLKNYRIIMWDVLTHDYSSALSAEPCLKRSINATRSGSLIVFHDSVKAERNMMHVLPRFIEHFLEKGYRFKSLSQ
jgi:peptidoglycan/xylan/chitin deacetylase (PgdA/CDA1 family)